MPNARFAAIASLLAFAACKAGTSTPDAGRSDAGYHPQALDGSVCDLGAVWLGDTCTVVDCGARADRTVCKLGDGDAGQCLAASCHLPIDYSSDSANCGANGAACAVGAVCSRSECLIDGGIIDTCDGVECAAGLGCLFAYCSRVSCAGATHDDLCLWGDAGGPGPWGNCCGGSCQALNTAENCGGCGVRCPTGYVCADQVCRPIDACGPGDNLGTCALDGGAGTCCNGACVDLGSDRDHCSNCGDTCPTGSACSGQVCRLDDAGASPPLANCEDAGCPAGALCATGWSCRPTTCPANSNGDNCFTPAGLDDGTCCGGACANTVADPANCGGCGIACKAGEICVSHACAEPLDCAKVVAGPCATDAGEYQGSCCEGKCVGNGYIERPAGNGDCGSCGAACPSGTHCGLYYGVDPICFSDIDAGPIFPPPACTADTCPPGRFCTGTLCFPGDCTGLSAGATCARGVDGGGGICCGGACVSQRAAGSCGSCGAACPAGSTCSGSSCTTACVADGGSCPTGSMCLLPQGVCLTTTCGTLGEGAACAMPGRAGTVKSGLCCGGACVDPLQDPQNCGSCGAFCPSGVCSGDEGTCFEDAPEACLVSCGPEQLCTGATCLSAVCPYVVPTPCASVYGTVGMCCPDRACADLTIDPLNCGRCGVACTADQACVSGACIEL